jgi:hypothetical protein
MNRDVESEKAVLEAFERRLRRLGVFRIQVQANFSRRSANVLSSLGYATSERFEFYLRVCEDMDSNWSALRKERRKKIRKALDSELTVVNGTDCVGVSALLDLHCEALEQKGIGVTNSSHQRERLYRHLLSTERAKLLICYLQSVPLGALLYGTFGDQACTLLSGSSSEGNHYGAMTLLHWKMIEKLAAQRIGIVNLGGVALQPGEVVAANGLYNFKKDWGGETVAQPSGVKTLPGLGHALSNLRDWYKRVRSKADHQPKAFMEAVPN